MLVVEEGVAVGFVEGFEDAAAGFGEDADFDVLVFEVDHVVGFVDFVGRW